MCLAAISWLIRLTEILYSPRTPSTCPSNNNHTPLAFTMAREANKNRLEKELQTAKNNVATLQREAALQRLFVSHTAAESV